MPGRLHERSAPVSAVADPRTAPGLRPGSVTRNNLTYSTRDGLCYTTMMGLGEANIVVFAVALGYGEVLSGLLGAVPLLGGALLQLISPTMVRRIGSHKRWIELCAFAQAMAFVPMGVGAAVGVMPPVLLFILAVLYWGATFAAGSTWHTYIGLTVPRRTRAKYFAYRNRVLNISLVVATLAAGWLLHTGAQAGWAMIVFAALFIAAATARLGSWYYTLLQVEITPLPSGFRAVPLRELAGRYLHGRGGRMIAYAVSAQLALQVSSPFVNPYLLKQIGLEKNYTMFGVLTAAVLLAKVIALPLWGRIAHSRGNRALLRLAGVLIVPVPLLWLLGENLWYLAVVQLITGAALAAYELAVFLMLLESIDDAERTSVMSRYQVVSQCGTLVGSLIGATVLHELGSDADAFAWVFVASALARMMTLALLARVQPLRPKPAYVQALEIELHPGGAGGSADQPLMSEPDDADTPGAGGPSALAAQARRP